MPLFGRHSADTAPAVPEKTVTTTTEPRRSGTLFSRHRTPSPPNRTGHGVLHRNEDASITSARERVQRAEAAERDADRALLQARSAVRDARDHVKRLEREAAEEARLAKLKQKQAQSISRRAKPLGRHDRV